MDTFAVSKPLLPRADLGLRFYQYIKADATSTRREGTKCLVQTPETTPQEAPRGRLPRITRLMALAIRFDGLIHSGAVENYSELARLGNVTRARMTQIMNLLMLAPAIQEKILFLPRVENGRDEVCLRDLQPVAGVMAWKEQTLNSPN